MKTEKSLIPYQRSQGQLPLTNQGLLSEDILNKNSSDTELAEWFNEKFAGFWSLYFPVAASVSYLFFFGIGGYLHVRTFLLNIIQEFYPKIIKTRYANSFLCVDFTCRNQLQQTVYVCRFWYVCISSI